MAFGRRIVKGMGDTITICVEEDISGGVLAELRNFKRWTLYLQVQKPIDVVVQLSPDRGETWFTIPESPISFTGTGTGADIIEFGYDATHIKLIGSNSNVVTAKVRGVY